MRKCRFLYQEKIFGVQCAQINDSQTLWNVRAEVQLIHY